MSDEKDWKSSQIHQLEQSTAAMAEYLPPMCRRFYLKLITDGFTEEQAFKLTMICVNGLCGGKFSC